MSEGILSLEQLALQFFDCGAFLTREQSPDGLGFRYKLHEQYPQAPLAPYKFNLRTEIDGVPGPLNEELLTAIAHCFMQMVLVKKLVFQHIAGVPNAGNALADAVAKVYPDYFELKSLSVIRLKKEVKKSGRQIVDIESGSFNRGEHVLLVDDIVTLAASKLEAIHVLASRGLQVSDIMVTVNGQAGGAERLRSLAYNLHPLFDFVPLLNMYREHDRIDQSLYREALAFNEFLRTLKDAQ